MIAVFDQAGYRFANEGLLPRELGRELEAALEEVLEYVRAEATLSFRIVDDPAAENIIALPGPTR